MSLFSSEQFTELIAAIGAHTRSPIRDVGDLPQRLSWGLPLAITLKASDFMSTISTTITVLRYVFYPATWSAVLLWELSKGITRPFVSIARIAAHICWLPIGFLARFEASIA